jgi:hypothetical protein
VAERHWWGCWKLSIDDVDICSTYPDGFWPKKNFAWAGRSGLHIIEADVSCAVKTN